MSRVLLLSMPFGAMERPSLGLSLLKARLEQEGIACDVRYLTFAFAEYIGHDDYQWMSYHLPYTAFAGDYSFTQALYGARPEVDRQYEDEILRGLWRLPDADVRRIQRVAAFVPHFIEYCLAAVRWHDYALVGFTSTFEQNISSLALAQRLKAQYPRLPLVFGGANWEGEMGHELHRQFPFVDYVCSGESEQTLPALARLVLRGDTSDASLASLPGLVYRQADGVSRFTGSPSMLRDLDALPYPDFSDYFHDLGDCTVSSPVVPTLLFETSRGCWWGAKSHCTFCGLNGQTMAFRAKTPRRALEELDHLTATWRLELVEAVDNILDMKYFADVLPALARAGRPLQIFYEVKANLSRPQVQLLRDAGVTRIQPGIESLSDHVLKLMRKGTTALRNIQLLKWAQEYGVIVEWNLLYGFPGETADDYEQMLQLLPAIRFLRPPRATGPIRLDRFSPYHATPESFGLLNIRPMAIYSYLYPFPAEALRRIAYYFDFDYAGDADPRGLATDVIAYANAWQHDQQRGTLLAVETGRGETHLVDTRPGCTVPSLTLSGLEQAAYAYCDEFHTSEAVIRHLRQRFPEQPFTDASVIAFLDSLVANRLMVSDGVHYLSLALRAPAVRPSTPSAAGGDDVALVASSA